jgi:hypothetical protein
MVAVDETEMAEESRNPFNYIDNGATVTSIPAPLYARGPDVSFHEVEG